MTPTQLEEYQERLLRATEADLARCQIERQQAIDALREIADETETICPGPNHDYEAVPTKGAKIARAALVNLGEQP